MEQTTGRQAAATLKLAAVCKPELSADMQIGATRVITVDGLEGCVREFSISLDEQMPFPSFSWGEQMAHGLNSHAGTNNASCVMCRLPSRRAGCQEPRIAATLW